MKFENQMEFFALLANQDSNPMKKRGVFSTLKTSKGTKPLFEISREDFKTVVFEKDKMKHRVYSRLKAFSPLWPISILKSINRAISCYPEKKQSTLI